MSHILRVVVCNSWKLHESERKQVLARVKWDMQPLKVSAPTLAHLSMKSFMSEPLNRGLNFLVHEWGCYLVGALLAMKSPLSHVKYPQPNESSLA